jgi:alpha-1,2-mannosyltransferase
MADSVSIAASPSVAAATHWKRVASLAAFWLIALFVVVVYSRREVKDYQVYIASGEALLQRKDLYRTPLPLLNTGPPFFSVLCAGPALLDRMSPLLGRVAWNVLNLAALLLLLDMAARLIHRRKVPLTSAPVIVPLVLTLPYLLYHLLYLQVNLIVFAISLAGLKLQEDRKEALGGVLVGAGAALKVMPILFVPYLFYRRRWVAACCALGATAVFTLLPGLILGWDLYRQDLQSWWAMVQDNPCWDAGPRNQSVLAMWDRFVGHGCIPLASTGPLYLEMSHAPGVRIAWLATVAVTGLWMLLSFRDRPARGSIGSVVEWCVIFVVSAIFGPVGWKHYLVVLLLPNMLLYWMWRAPIDVRTRQVAAATLWGCLLLDLISARQLGTSWSMRVGMASNQTIAALVMIGGLLWLRRKTSAIVETEPAAGRNEPQRFSASSGAVQT